MREIIVNCFPIHFEKYVEVFGGAAWVLFHKKPSKFEVYNDQNKNLTTFYRCVREQPEELKAALKYVLNSREDFFRIVDQFRKDSDMADIQRAANYYQLIRQSYASSCDSFSCQPHDMWRDFPLIDAAHERLRGVVIENQDFSRLITHYDSAETLTYCDPPYVGTEFMYDFVTFTSESHILLRDTLIGVEGYFLLSYNDCEFVRDLYNLPGIYIKEVSRLNNIKQRYDGGNLYSELLIANFDLNERSRVMDTQMSLFERSSL